MEHLQSPRLLDERGNPLSSRIEEALRSLVPKFRRRYPAVQDEVELTQILKKAGTKIAVREERSGPIEKLHGYAWVTLRNVTASWRRRGSTKLRERSVGSEAGDAILGTAQAQEGTPEQIERRILLREAMAHLTEDERMVVDCKVMGFSAEAIAKIRGSSTAAVNMVFSRAKQKLAQKVPRSSDRGRGPGGTGR
jgi:RNA polymerase sigma factor (sigma-70 family)